MPICEMPTFVLGRRYDVPRFQFLLVECAVPPTSHMTVKNIFK